MAFEGYSYNKELIGDNNGDLSGNIQTSGLYPILIERLEYKEKQNDKYPDGLRKEFSIAYSMNGKKGYLYGLPINKVDGELNQRTQKIINNLMSICGVFKDLKAPVKTTVERTNGDSTEVLHFKELADKEVIVYVKAQYSKFNNKIYKNLQVVDFFQKGTKASISELLAKDPNKYGQRYEKMKEKGFDTQVEYTGVTVEEAEHWEEMQKKNSNKQGTTPDVGTEDDEIPF